MSLLIGNYIFSRLSSDEDVARIVGDRIFPIAIPELTNKNFIQYDGISVKGEYTKDGLVSDNVAVSVKCASNKFGTASVLADNVRIVLESSSVKYDSYSIGCAELENSSVGYDSGLYVFELNFKFQTNY